MKYVKNSEINFLEVLQFNIFKRRSNYALFLQFISYCLFSILTLSVSNAWAVGPNTAEYISPSIDSYATPDGGTSTFISFKHVDNEITAVYTHGYFSFSSDNITAYPGGCSEEVSICDGTQFIGNARTLAFRPPNGSSPITTLLFAVSGTQVSDSVSKYALIEDGTGALWAIDRLPATPITTANAASRIQICKPSDNFNPATGCSSTSNVFLPLDVDGDGQVTPLTDGLLILRYFFQFSGNSLIQGAIGSGATRTTAPQISAYLSELSTLDIDGDGQITPLTDGLLLLRYLFQFSGNSLIAGAIGNDATRLSATEISSYITNDVNTITPNEPTKVTISGKAGFSPIIGGNVVIKDLGGSVIGSGVTDENGAYAVEVNEKDIVQQNEVDDVGGYEIIVSGGQLGAVDFTDEMRAVYSENNARDQANVSVITTLIKKYSVDLNGIDLLDKKEKAIQKLISLGMLKNNRISDLDLEFVNENVVQKYISEDSISIVIDELILDIFDDVLSYETMLAFPFGNGGIRRIIAGSNEPIALFAGKEKTLKVGVESINIDSFVQSPTFSIEDAPNWITLENDTISISPPYSTEAKDYNFVINAAASGVAIGRNIDVKVTVINQFLLVSGTLGINGGKIENRWKDIVISTDFGDLSQEYSIDYLVGINSYGALSYHFKTTPEMPISERLKVKIIKPNNDVIKNNYLLPSLSTQQKNAFENNRQVRLARLSSVESTAVFGVQQVCIEELPRWFDGNSPINEADGHTFDYIWQGRKALFKDTRDIDKQGYPRVLSNITTNTGVDDLHEKCSSSLRSSVKWDDPKLILNEPVLFVHGFIGSGKLGGLDINPEIFGDDIVEEYFGSFPKMVDDLNISGREFNSFLFQWRTNARFQDVGAELGEAVREITEKTGKQVHIVAHSFGGLLTRTLVQGLSSNSEFGREFAEKNIATITTVGTPHSGIFSGFTPSSARNIEFNDEGKIQFPIGTDSYAGAAINLCRAITCYQSGESWDELSNPNYSEQIYGTKNQDGYIVYKLAKSVINYPDIPTQVLMGIVPADVDCKKSGENSCKLTYTLDSPITDHPGDSLISIEGQRFLPSLKLEPVYESTYINEHILPFKTKDFTVGSADTFLSVIKGGVNSNTGLVTYPDEIPVTFSKNVLDGKLYPKILPSLSGLGFYYGNNHRTGQFDENNFIFSSISGFTFVEIDSEGNEAIVERDSSLSIQNSTEVGLHECRNNSNECLHPTWLYFDNLVSLFASKAIYPEEKIEVSGFVFKALEVNNASGQIPVSNAKVSIYQNDKLIGSTLTDIEGFYDYSINFKANTAYKVSVTPPTFSLLRGLESELLTTSNTVEDSSLNFPVFELVSTTFAEGELGIQVSDETSMVLSDYEVEIKNYGGRVLEDVKVTSNNAVFTLPTGNYSVIVTKAGYISSTPKYCGVEANLFKECNITISPPGSIPNNGLVAHYGFDGNVDDSSGNNNNAAGYGINYSNLNGREIIQLNSNDESRLQLPYSYMPMSGSLVMDINVSSGYRYSNSVFSNNLDSALIFTTDIQGGDVTYAGSSWLTVNRDGDISFSIATSKYGNTPRQVVKIDSTDFRFDAWHQIGISFGITGQKIYLDGQILIENSANTEELGAGGNHSSPIDIPTIGESVPGFWSNNQYEGGFNGMLDDVFIYDRALNSSEISILNNLQ